MRKIPMRKCVATQEAFPKKELIRIVRTPDLQIVIDETGKQNGRGAYLRKTKDAVLMAKKTNALGRALEITIPEEIYNSLLEIVDE
jgi:Predicted nucleic-acid-binding protein implicated in transcription termination